MQRILATLMVFFALPVAAIGAEVKAIRAWHAPDYARLVFDVSEPVSHKIFSLGGPDRVVVDINGATLSGSAPSLAGSERFVTRIRSGVRQVKDLRVVIDLKERVRIKSFLLPPNSQYGHRLVVDLLERESQAAPRATIKKAAPLARSRDIVVAIDAGHGGEDPGAIGRRGIREKDVVLAIATRLKRALDAESGMRGVLVRTSDYYIPLRKRMEIARRHKADFFVSIHADSFRDQRARGSSVFVLSKRGASSEAARWLAEKENSADLVGGVSLDDKDDMLASVLLDLSQSASMQASHDAASRVLANLKMLGPTHGSSVQQARFMVLKSPDIPSMLVETAFISNPAEERKLRSRNHQEHLATAIARGIKDYFSRYPPPGTLYAQRDRENPRTHIIAPGDTLSDIAIRYRISLARLREHNGLSGDRIRVGQTLQIPVEG
ncbi:MAG: N-acetylmuramoyl-L-alanine amidase [Pseudomonadota bacterium]